MKKLLLICVGLLVGTTFLQAHNVKGNAPLVESQNFSAIYNGGKVDISWKSIIGTSNACFTIEKSKDGINYSKVIDVSHISTGNGYRDYTEVDYKPYKGKSYYRLKQTDKSGNSKYFAPVVVEHAAQKKIAVYHMPLNATDDFNEYVGEQGNEEVLIVLKDEQGNEFVSKVFLMMEKNVVFLLDKKKLVPKGNYVITSSSDNKIYNYKLVVR